MSEKKPFCVRTATFDCGQRDAAGRVPVVVSTDSVVEVADGPEILVHTPDAVDLCRAPIPIIATHMGGQVNIGLVEDPVADGHQLRGWARFGARPEADGYRRDVEAGVIRSVSVGYQRGKCKVRADGVLVTTRWMPTHAALVAEPADIGAGFYRERIADMPFEITTESTAPEAEVQPAEVTPTAPAVVPVIHMEKTMQAAETTAAGAEDQTRTLDVLASNEDRMTALRALGAKHKIDDAVVRGWIANKVTAEAAGIETMNILLARQGEALKANPAEIGMTKAEAKRFSSFNAIRAIINKDWSKAGLEREAHEAIMKRMGGNPMNENTFYIPVEVQNIAKLREVRDMTSAGVSGSNYLVGTDNISFIDLLRNRSVLFRMGATRMGGLVGNVTIPKQTASATAYWLTNEATAITEGQPTIGQLSLSPKHVGAYTEISRFMALQSSPDAESLVMNDLAKTVATAADLAGLAGTNSGGQPQGIVGLSGVGAVTGTSIAYAGLLEFQTDIGNALSPQCGYVTTPTVAALLAQRVKFSSTASPLWDGSILDANCCGFPGMSSAQCPTGDIIFGDWSQVVVAEWGSLAVEVNPYANFQSGIIGVRALYAMDIGVRIPGAFSVATSVT